MPGKNVEEIAGKPLIAYSIEAALQSRELTAVWVSSDDDEILEVARQYEEVQIHARTAELASDSSPVTDTLAAVLKQSWQEFDAMMILQPTSPIRTGKQIDGAVQMLKQSPEANSLISVVPMDDVHPARMYWKEDGHLNPVLPQYEQSRRQDIPTAWYRNGSIYLVRVEAFQKEHAVMVKPSIGYEMPASQLLNIDEPRDLITAEPLIKAWQRGEL